MVEEFELVVIGSGPGGQRAAVQAAKLKKKVAIVEGRRLGGSCLHLGTIPSKSLREAALSLDRADPLALQKAYERAVHVIEADESVIRNQLERNQVRIFQGFAQFETPFQIKVLGTEVRLKSPHFILATGNRPRRPQGIEFSAPIFDSDTILSLRKKPQSLAVMGGGVIGCEYASIFAALGARVSIYDRRRELLRDLDPEVLIALKAAFTRAGIQLRLGEETVVEKLSDVQASVTTDKDKHTFDAVLYCQGRMPNVEELNLEALSLKVTEKGTLAVNSTYQTECSHVYAVGDLQGAPGLATSAAEQGRMASAKIFNHFAGDFPQMFPYGVYTIPEISSVGLNETQVQEQKIPYVVGRARYKELARGKIIGDEDGLLKMIVCKQSQKILGVHVIGTQATELIHIGQVAMALGADLKFFVGNVFNYPTLAEAYKVAAFQAFNEIAK